MEPVVRMYYHALANVEHSFRQIKDDAVLSVLVIGLIAVLAAVIVLRLCRK